MSRKKCPPNNAACEGLFGHLKNEMFYLCDVMVRLPMQRASQNGALLPQRWGREPREIELYLLSGC